MVAFSQDTEKARTVGIIGLGYVGLPLAMNFIAKGYRVVGIDTDPRKLESLRAGRSHVQDVSDQELGSCLAEGILMITGHYADAAKAGTIIICVPTPLAPDHTPDLGFLLDACRRLSAHLQPGQLVIVESSTYPGTTTEQVQPLLEGEDRKAGRDFYLAYSPERIDPGNRSISFHQIAKIVSGVTEACLERVQSIYRSVFETVIPVSSTAAAETMKLLENTYRFINISFINEMAMLCDHLGLNAWEIIAAAASKPYGFSAFYPGPGVGGHCIPVDPFYLQWKAAQSGQTSRFIEIAQHINDGMPAYLVEEIRKHLPEGKSLRDARIVVYGVTYKQNIADVRESTAIAIIEALREQGADVGYSDPYLAKIRLTDGSELERAELTAESLEVADCLVILTHHSSLPIRLIADHASFVYDTRNAITALRPGAKLVTLGNGARPVQ
ncbi:nucleotide sugar dehydrogenase [Paenibacillus sp. R14(2021)]|uniref:nucleotide sugar dehydrogenase n=1 Tax=Paenibacillus sp. R14(2021) TaxID=2859228 RepID=UPI001C616963|nr:nucleotide sugar dehydrogenase [Paenibacillus sp. R14(2021)]